MKTGTDVSLRVCRAEGYPVVEHGKRPLDPKQRYRLTISDPAAWNDAGTAVLINRRMIGNHPTPAWDTDDWFSYEELWQRFVAGGAGIKSFCDFENCPPPSPEQQPGFLDFVGLASILRWYCGLP
jgi:hypothetical protein